MYEAIFRIGNRRQLIRTAGRDVRVDLWCNDHCDLVRAVGTDAETVIEDIDTSIGVADQIVDGEEHVVVTDGCLAAHRPDNIELYVGRHGCLLLPPLQYVNGDRVCRILSLTADALSDLYQDIINDDNDVTVQSKRSVSTVTSDAPLLDPKGIVPEFTARQREVLLTAIRCGYYEIPREVTTAEIAESVDVQRRTAENHLRRAERKTVNAISDYLY